MPATSALTGEGSADSMAWMSKRATAGGRPRVKRSSPLGVWLDRNGRSRKWLAERLEVTENYAHKLARGDVLPSILVAAAVERITHGKIGLRQWVSLASGRRRR